MLLFAVAVVGHLWSLLLLLFAVAVVVVVVAVVAGVCFAGHLW